MWLLRTLFALLRGLFVLLRGEAGQTPTDAGKTPLAGSGPVAPAQKADSRAILKKIYTDRLAEDEGKKHGNSPGAPALVRRLLTKHRQLNE